MGNTEGTSEPEDSVQTARVASAQFNDLREVCQRIPGTKHLATHYEVTVPEMSAELKRQGIIKFNRRDDVDWGDDLEAAYWAAGSVPALARKLGTTEKITYKELRNRGIQLRPRGHLKGQEKSQAWRDASAKHWDDPAWREEQRQKWLDRLPVHRGNGQPSRPEVLLRETFRAARISYTSNASLHGGRYFVDILIHQKPVVIEADGSSHYIKSARESDRLRDADLTQDGYTVVRLDYRDIDSDVSACVNDVIMRFKLQPEESPVFVDRTIHEALGERTRQLREDDPEHRERWLANLREGQKRRRERESGG